jgi:hypothetical protein
MNSRLKDLLLNYGFIIGIGPLKVKTNCRGMPFEMLHGLGSGGPEEFWKEEFPSLQIRVYTLGS